MVYPGCLGTARKDDLQIFTDKVEVLSHGVLTPTQGTADTTILHHPQLPQSWEFIALTPLIEKSTLATRIALPKPPQLTKLSETVEGQYTLNLPHSVCSPSTTRNTIWPRSSVTIVGLENAKVHRSPKPRASMKAFWSLLDGTWGVLKGRWGCC